MIRLGYNSQEKQEKNRNLSKILSWKRRKFHKSRRPWEAKLMCSTSRRIREVSLRVRWVRGGYEGGQDAVIKCNCVKGPRRFGAGWAREEKERTGQRASGRTGGCGREERRGSRRVHSATCSWPGAVGPVLSTVVVILSVSLSFSFLLCDRTAVSLCPLLYLFLSVL